jgi:hypothetical protein
MTDTRSSSRRLEPGDVMAYYAPEGTAAPTAFADPTTPWVQLGWVSTNGGDVKRATQTTDLTAAGSFYPIASRFTSATATLEITFDEPMNPAVRALWDDVAVSALTPETGTQVSYDLPMIPSGTHYALLLRTIGDNGKKLDLYAPSAMVTDRGDETYPTDNYSTLDMTFTLYPPDSVTPAISRTLDYGTADNTAYFGSGS